MTAYAFRPMSADDLPTIRRWLEAPHVSEWWHDPAEQFEIVSGDLDHPDMAQFIVAADGQEFAYLQCYNFSSAFVRAFADGLLVSGTPRVVTDPDPANTRAIKAYERAGFRRDRVVETPDGPALLMMRDQ
jgi:aminoglycoside 6'-N-acetyltransferase